MLLGPETFGPEGLYQYSIVTKSDRTALFVLARDPDIFREEYDTEVIHISLNLQSRPLNCAQKYTELL